jgi:hypothetical protein
MNRYLRINSALKVYANDKNQITKKGIQTMYEKSGAICK